MKISAPLLASVALSTLIFASEAVSEILDNESFGNGSGDASGNPSLRSTAPLTVAPVNHPPMAIAQAVSVAEDGSVEITLVGNDPDGDSLTFATGSATQGTVSLVGAVAADNHGKQKQMWVATYTPAANYNGTDSFSFTVNDGTATSSPATVSLTVTPVNDPPLANAQAVSLAEDGSVAITLAGSDPDGDSLTFLTGTAAHGTVTLAGAVATYTPAANYNGTDSFSFTVNDGTVTSTPATVSLTVTPVNDPPVAVADAYATAANTPLLVTAAGVLANDSDADGNPLTASKVSAPAHGTLALAANGGFSYTPGAGFTGPDSFTYRANDGTADSNVATVSITVRATVPEGMSEVWKARYDAQSLMSEDDSDSDGKSNAEEATAGTDPLDSMSSLRITIGEMVGNQVRIDIPSQPGKCYQVFYTNTLLGPWTAHGSPVLALGNAVQIRAPRPGASGFYRVGVSDCDSDGDGLTDWDELQLVGFDPNKSDSFSSGIPGNDLAVAREMLKTGLVTASVSTPVAYESDGTHAIVTFTRHSAATYPIRLFLRVSGASDPTKSSASASDFLLQDATGGPISSELVIPAGVSAVELHIVPLGDSLREVPEEVHIAIGSSAGVSVTIRDAPPTLANQVFFLANLRPIFGTGSLGSGVAVLRLHGDNDIATIVLSFSNLQSPVSSVKIQSSDGTLFQTITPAGYASYNWAIRASGSFPTDLITLNALLSAGVELSIKTVAHPNGEIRGTFIVSSGSTILQSPPAPAPIEPLVDSNLARDIARFLTQATFGPTMADITALRALVASHSGDRIAAFGEWIDQQFALPSPSLLDYVVAAGRQEIEIRAALPADHPDFSPAFNPQHRNRIRGWWLLARHAPDQLRQRAAFALSEIFVISDHDPVILDRPYGTAHYYDMLRSGVSGSYRDLLGGVATHPVMGQYLSHLRNEKAVLNSTGDIVVSPDENFAREIMQLFSIGLVELHPDGSLKLGSDGLPIPTYGQNDITGMARVLTGWSFGSINDPPSSDTVVTNTNFYQGNGISRHEAQWTHPLASFPAYHDTGAKTVLGTSIPAGQTGGQDLATVLDRLASHPNTAPFICRRLIQRLVTANPSSGYLYRVANAFTNTGGNLAATIKAILLDPEARSLDTATSGFGKKREPLLRFAGFLRAFDAKSQLLLSDLAAYGYPAGELAKFPAGTTRVRLDATDGFLSQTPLSAPSVFNWFVPDHMPSGLLAANGLTSPEFKLANENSVFLDTNFLFYQIFMSIYLSPVPGQSLPPYNYSSTAQCLKTDLAPLEALYMAAVDVNGDGVFTSLDSSTFNNPSAIPAACAAVIDRIDLLLCAGSLKAQYGTTPGQPRRIILDAVTAIRSAYDGGDDAASQAYSMRVRINNALWLVMSSPAFVIQK